LIFLENTQQQKINSRNHEITVNIHDSVLCTAKKYHNKRVQGIKLHICQGSTMHKLQPLSYPKYAKGKTKSNIEQDQQSYHTTSLSRFTNSNKYE
jgi:hypothetical protein